MRDNVILLVEDNPDDELLTLRALKKNNITGKVVVAVTVSKPWTTCSPPASTRGGTRASCRS
jgi:hypothetical protein